MAREEVSEAHHKGSYEITALDKEIAQMLDIPIGTVMSRLHRGRKFMQKRLYDLARDRGIAAARAMPRPAD